MGFVRLLPRSSRSRRRLPTVETEPSARRSSDFEPEPDPSSSTRARRAPLPTPLAPAAPRRSSCRRRPDARRDRHPRDRVREPEGRRREDDDDAEPRGRVQGDGLPRPARRPRPAGQPDDEPGAQPRHDRDLDVRRARAEDPDLGRDRATRGRSRRRVDRPRRRRAGVGRADRPRTLAREGAARGARPATTSS